MMNGKLVRAGLILLLITQTALAQELTLSPYSRYAIGDLVSNTTIRNTSMGGLTVANNNLFSVNPGNPASFADLMLTAFDFSGFGQFSQLRATSKVGPNRQENQFTAGVQNASYGFANRRLNLAFGFAPYSAVGYKISDVRPIVVQDSSLVEKTTYTGNGGLNSAFIGLAGRVLENRLRIGASFTFAFGNMTYDWGASIINNSGVEVTAYRPVTGTEDVYIRGGVFQGGLIYQDTLNKEKEVLWRLGITASQGLEMKADRFSTFQTSSYLDTLINSEQGTVQLPPSLGVGLHVAKNNFWSVGVEATLQNWQNFQYFTDTLSLGRELRLAAGMEIAPNPESFNYFKRIDYRFGAYWKTSYLSFDEVQLQDMGLTFGIGLPATRKGGGRNDPGRITSRVNLGVEAGRRGNISAGLPLEEYYLRIRVGATLNDLWFIRRVVD